MARRRHNQARGLEARDSLRLKNRVADAVLHIGQNETGVAFRFVTAIAQAEVRQKRSRHQRNPRWQSDGAHSARAQSSASIRPTLRRTLTIRLGLTPAFREPPSEGT